ncbi:universal stress protein [Maribacter polysiphoniae]|uniref:Nucleotide-binding universal stress UspA family protein n=1 Tax=Maribacter polysiphoniae TaxID=429344 RepID=A0A316E327_9FLAO|nr:universal stress protein [Maribacter polysiphoniae]MBD1259744.1 universal stress protein [Maribacter polysiphoniae]PWK23113.1 nucleotide-binding universal stress UspA family protein [Maribacter polysiphoniae]
MKTFLYATDFSQNSVAALLFAHALSQELHAKLVVLHVFELPMTFASTVSNTYSRMEVRAFAEHREKLLAFCAEHLKEPPEDLDITYQIDEGKPIGEIIIKNALEVKADLIVVGAKGGSRLKEAFLGSTTAALIDNAPCPILAVPNDVDFQGIKKMVYATDFEGADIFTVEKMIQLAEPLDIELHLVHISSKDRTTSEDQLKWFKDMLHHKVIYENIHFDLRYGKDVFETLQSYIDEVAPDMVAMLEREGHSLIKDLKHRDLVKRMKSESHIPLLSYHKKNIKN